MRIARFSLCLLSVNLYKWHNDSMDKTIFSTYLTTNLALPEEAIDHLLKDSRRLHLEPGDFALRAGDLCKHTFFVEQGLLKQYSIDEKGKEHILLFAPEHWFASNIESVHFGRPSQYFIEAIEPSQVLLISPEAIHRLGQCLEEFQSFGTRLLYTHIATLQSRVTELQSADAEERYLQFVRTYPSLTLRVSQKQIASFLGITPESLSRVRRELALRK